MITAMQELIKRVLRNGQYIPIELQEEMLEKEKEQIIEARIDGDENYSLIGGKRYEYAEQYYNETYNQNES
jgi:hypothetical protein